LASIASHEGGHNLGLGHASSLDFGSTPLGSPGAAGVWNEYGDPFDVMGGSFAQYDAPHKHMLNWLPPGSELDVNASGIYTIGPLESTTNMVRALRVSRGSTDKYLWLEYRQPIGVIDSNLIPGAFAGALIHYEDPDDPDPDHAGHSALLTFHPSAIPNDFTQAALEPGEIWVDPYSTAALKVSAGESQTLNVTVSYSGALLVQPLSLSFSAQQMGPATASQILSVSSNGATLAYTVSVDAPWLMTASGSGTTQGNITISTDAENLQPGTYSGNVIITAAGTINSPLRIPVTLTLLPPAASPLPRALSPSNGSGSGGVFTLTADDPQSYAEMTFAYIGISSSAFSSTNECILRYDVTNQQFQLLGDDGVTWGSLVDANSLTLEENSACIFNAAASGAFGLGHTLTVTAAVAFKAAFAGQHSVFGRAQSALYDSGWQEFGNWSVNTNPGPVGALPNNGAGTHQIFTFVYTDPGGASDLVWLGAQFAVNNQSIANGCVFYAYASYGQLGFWDDSGTTVSWMNLGQSGTVSNSTCSINGAGTFFTVNGDMVTLTADITFLEQGAGRLLSMVMNGSGKSFSMPSEMVGTWKTGTIQGSQFVPSSPCRVVDTRSAAGSLGGPFVSSGTSRAFPLTASTTCSIPSTAQAYSLNLTVVPHGTLGYVTMWPTGQTQPVVSTLNSLDGRVKANASIMPAGTNGAVSVYATDDADVILDINGYFMGASNSSAEAFYPVNPCRLVDTRAGAASTVSSGALIGGTSRTLPLLSSGCNVPATATAYSLNFTVVPSNGTLGYLTVYPTGVTQPVVSTLNAPTGTVVANAAILPAGTGGSIDVFATDTTDLVVDINGYFAAPGTGGLSFYPVPPCRVLDSRSPPGSPPFTNTMNVNVIGSGCANAAAAEAYVFNATVVPSGSLGYLTLWPEATAQPVVSTLNALDGSVTSNMAIAPASNNAISAYASDPTYLILDTSGYFAP
jgi:hypothetical protein